MDNLNLDIRSNLPLILPSKRTLATNCAHMVARFCLPLVLASQLLVLFRLDASQSAINPFTNPDPFAVGKQVTQEEQKEVDTALSLIKKHNEDGAIQWLKAQAKDHPDHWRVWVLLCMVYLKQNRYQESVDAANAALRKSQGDMNRAMTVAILSYKGVATAKLSRFQESLNCYLEITRIEPNNPFGYYWAGKLLLSFPTAADRARALPMVKRANDLSNRRNPAVLDLLAEAYATTGDRRTAISSEKEAIRWAPANYKGYFQSRLQIYTVD
jgi:tetratricopeptide (TPR) repeat protein